MRVEDTHVCIVIGIVVRLALAHLMHGAAWLIEHAYVRRIGWGLHSRWPLPMDL